MSISYDSLFGAFLSKITEFDLVGIAPEARDEIVTGYMKRAVSQFRSVCKSVVMTADDTEKLYDVDIQDEDIDELINIISEGMVAQWLKPYVFKQELLENVLNTRDYSTYSPANLLLRVRETYQKAQNDFTQMIREYSYSHGDLTVLHL